MPTLPLAVVALLRASAPSIAPPPASGRARVADADRREEYRLKADFLERFTHFADCPAREGAERPGEPLHLCVLGEDPFGDTLEPLVRRHGVDERPLELRHPRTSREAAGCQLLFIARSESERLDEVLAATAGHGVLTVGDSEGFAGRGVIINLFVADEKVGFEVNQDVARREGFELSAKLLKLARLVGGSGGVL
jgi:hypothetical protein